MKRYDVDYDDGSEEGYYEAEKGAWVMWDDVAELVEENARLREQIDEMIDGNKWSIDKEAN